MSERIYIVVKTYPTISKKYAELVCTAGVRDDGSWIRLYPMPFRALRDEQKYPKYTWIQVDTERNPSDFRPESYRPHIDTIKVEEKPKKADWEERRKILFKNKKIYTNLAELINDAHKEQNYISLALFKPTEIFDFEIKEDSLDWDPEKLSVLREEATQLNFFQTREEVKKEFQAVKKLPYKFSYCFKDDEDRESKLMISDWEIGALYFNCLKGANGNKTVALDKVKKKYFSYFKTRDIYFILGTTKKNHFVSKNPFIIIGVFYPPLPKTEPQAPLF